MCKKFLIICLVLIMVSVCYSYTTLFSWEQQMDGWTVQDGYFGDYYNSPAQMVTNGSWALGLTPDEPGFAWSLFNGDMYGVRGAFMNAVITADVTWVASEWSGTNIWAKWDKVAINSAPGLVEFNPIDTANPSYPGSWDPYNWGAVHTRRLKWDPSTYNWAGVEGSGWLQLSMSTSFGGDAGFIWGNFYIDNVWISPEPATIALLGFGGLALLRRKR